jgi:hypothetical protein
MQKSGNQVMFHPAFKLETADGVPLSHLIHAHSFFGETRRVVLCRIATEQRSTTHPRYPYAYLGSKVVQRRTGLSTSTNPPHIAIHCSSVAPQLPIIQNPRAATRKDQ